ncbi:MAG: YkvA family protein [Tepidisphaeraceae bacterium]
MVLLSQAKDWARRIKRDVVTVYFAARDPRTPLVARVLAMAVAAYALSPIDLIPDFIPILGYLDDLIIVPLGLILVVRLIPPEVLVTSREKAVATLARPKSRAAAWLVVIIWLLCAAGVGYWWIQR